MCGLGSVRKGLRTRERKGDLQKSKINKNYRKTKTGTT